MRKRTVTLVALLVALTAGIALAADLTGTWTGSMGGGDGGGFALTYHFKQDGAKLTGTMDGPQGDPLQIQDGKVDGDKVSFFVAIDFGGQGMKLIQSGTIKGDEILLNTKMEGGPGGGDGPGPMTLKRSK